MTKLMFCLYCRRYAWAEWKGDFWICFECGRVIKPKREVNYGQKEQMAEP